MMKLPHVLVLALAVPGPLAAQAPAKTPDNAVEIAPLPAKAAASLVKEIVAELKADDLVALQSRFDEPTEGGAAGRQAARILGGRGRDRRTPEIVRRAAHQLGRGIHARVHELHVREAAGRAEAHVPLRRASGGHVSRSRRSFAPRLEDAGVRDAGRVPRARGAGRLGLRVSSRDPCHARGRRAFPGCRPRARLGAAGPRRDDRRHRPFQDLAQGLASRGIAVLRYDKRTKVYQKDLAGTRDMTIRQEVIDDALAAVKLLRATAGMDPERIFLAGHSLGAVLAPRIGVLDGSLAGVVLLAAPSRPMSEVVRDQARSLLEPGAPEAQRRGARHPQGSGRSGGVYAGRPGPPSGTILGASVSYWLDLRVPSSLEAARSFGKPILILQGERDYQVSMADFAGWKKAARRPRGRRLQVVSGPESSLRARRGTKHAGRVRKARPRRGRGRRGHRGLREEGAVRR